MTILQQLPELARQLSSEKLVNFALPQRPILLSPLHEQIAAQGERRLQTPPLCYTGAKRVARRHRTYNTWVEFATKKLHVTDSVSVSYLKGANHCAPLPHKFHRGG